MKYMFTVLLVIYAAPRTSHQPEETEICAAERPVAASGGRLRTSRQPEKTEIRAAERRK